MRTWDSACSTRLSQYMSYNDNDHNHYYNHEERGQLETYLQLLRATETCLRGFWVRTTETCLRLGGVRTRETRLPVSGTTYDGDVPPGDMGTHAVTHHRPTRPVLLRIGPSVEERILPHRHATGPLDGTDTTARLAASS